MENPRKNPPFLLVAIAVVGALIAGYFALRRPEPVSPPSPAPVAQKEPALPADATLPPAEQSDEQVRAQLAEAAPKAAPYLKEKGLLERWVQVANALAEDRSPREPLTFLAPKERFRASKQHGMLAMDPQSQARYDTFGDMVASVDAKKLAAAVKALRPLLESAYHSLGYAGKSIDDLAGRALSRIVRAPAPEGPAELVEAGAVYKFTDPQLEGLGAVEKHLLRLGPRNEKMVQQKAAELLDALGLPQTTAKQP